MQIVLEQVMASSATLDATSAAASGTLRRVLDEVRLRTKMLWVLTSLCVRSPRDLQVRYSKWSNGHSMITRRPYPG